jgi:undecaprenyl-diphosphatase
LLIKVLVGRPRPPASDWLASAHDWAFPSQHAAQALATWGMLALMVMVGRSLRTRTLLLVGAALIALVVGLTRLYLAVHWMTDVLGGWALAGVWGCLLIIPYLFTQRVAMAPQDREARRPGRPRPRARSGRGTGIGRKPAGGKAAPSRAPSRPPAMAALRAARRWT